MEKISEVINFIPEDWIDNAHTPMKLGKSFLSCLNIKSLQFSKI